MRYFNLKMLLMLALLSICFQSCGDDGTSPSDGNNLTEPEVVYDNIFTYQSAYIRSLQIPSGAIKDTESSISKITPYFANFACLGLLKEPTDRNIATVKKYMEWYISKLNGNINPHTEKAEIEGSIYDYFGDSESTKGTYDSVDSYAATFLMLAVELAKISEEHKNWVKQYADKLALITRAMEACIDTDYNNMPGSMSKDDNDWLSVASHVYDVKYLMDNCEVNSGLKAAIWLQENSLMSGETGDLKVLLEKNTLGIEKELWRNATYNWHDNGSTSAISKWTVFYADATCQLYPGLFEVIDPVGERANKLYTEFNRYYPNWSTGEVYSGSFPWTLIVYAAATINDVKRVNEYMEHIHMLNIKGEQKEYWYSMEAAFMLLGVDKIRNTTMPEYVPVVEQ